MTSYGLLTFCAVYAVAVAVPGPGIAAIIARGLAHGLKGTPAFIAGFMVGDLAWFAIAATGLAALAKTAATHGWHAFLASLLLTLANPKAILFFVALLPTVVDLASMNLVRFVEISAAMCVVLPTVLGVYALLAARARELIATPKAVRRLNRGSGVALAGAAIAVATR